MKEEIKNFIKENSTQPQTWLQREISKHFGCIINLHTIRSAKKTLGCLTNWKQLRKSYIPFIKDNYKVLTDEEMATMLSTIYNRKISFHLVKKIRNENNLHRETSLTVKELRPCRNCGKLIKITCRRPHQVYCSLDCEQENVKKRYAKRNAPYATPEKVKEFLKKYGMFMRNKISHFGYDLAPYEKEDIYVNGINLIPYILYTFAHDIDANEKMRKAYISKAMRNLVYQKCNKKKRKLKYEPISINDERQSFRF